MGDVKSEEATRRIARRGGDVIRDKEDGDVMIDRGEDCGFWKPLNMAIDIDDSSRVTKNPAIS